MRKTRETKNYAETLPFLAKNGVCAIRFRLKCFIDRQSERERKGEYETTDHARICGNLSIIMIIITTCVAYILVIVENY